MPKDKLNFKLNHNYFVNGYKIPYELYLKKSNNPLIFKPTSTSLIKKLALRFAEPVLYFLLGLRNYLLVDGFIENTLGIFIRKYMKEKLVFLEIGCGDMSMRRFLPKNSTYNAFDVNFSKYYLDKALKDSRSNIAIASVLDIPLPDHCVDVILISEVLYEIKNINKAIKEIYRILKKGGVVIISTSNSFCYKYAKKGPHPRAKNFWTFESFTRFMNRYKFTLLESKRGGIWVPLPRSVTDISYQLPFSSSNEKFNCYFFFVFAK